MRLFLLKHAILNASMRCDVPLFTNKKGRERQRKKGSEREIAGESD